MTQRLPIIAAGLLCCAGAQAAGQSYFTLVGHLISESEGPRLMRDFCAEVAPDLADKNARGYEAWRERNSSLLALVQVQRDHASVRYAAIAAQDPSVPQSMDAMLELLLPRLFANLHKKSPEEQRKPCVEYVEFLTAHEAELADVIRAVLKTVTEADEELSKRKAEE